MRLSLLRHMVSYITSLRKRCEVQLIAGNWITGKWQRKSLAKRAAKPSRAGATRRDDKPRQPRLTWRSLQSILPIFALFVFAGLSYSAYSRIMSVPTGELIVMGCSGSAANPFGVTPEQVQNFVADDVSNGFWAVDLAATRARLEQLPWVRQVNIRRAWPNKLMIGIDEHVAVARWNYMHLLTATGQLISPNDAADFSHLPHFIVEASLQEAAGIYNPAASGESSRLVGDVMQARQQSSSPRRMIGRVVSVREMIAQFNDLQKPLLQRGFAIDRFWLNASGDLSLGLNNGVRVELGRDRIAQRFLRFITVYDQNLHSKFDEVLGVDLRYSNGASVQWRARKASS